MEVTEAKKIRSQLVCPRLPLAVYREVAAHIRQISGVDAELMLYLVGDRREINQQKFDYAQSQVKGLSVEYSQDLTENNKQRLEEILDYYGRRYAPWQELAS
jgi:hypothetical protein